MLRVPALAMVLAAGVAGPARADAADDEHTNDHFGRAVAVDGDWAAVGAIGDNTAAFDAGAVYMYERTGDGWTLHSRLVPADSDGGTWLGNALALDGDTLIAGSTVAGTNARRGGRGAARIYVRDGDAWREQAVLRLGDDVVEDGFGFAVALAGDDAAVASDHALVDGAYHGAEVRIYRRDGDEWGERSTLALDARRGAKLAFAGDMLAVATGMRDAEVALYRRDGDAWAPAGTISAAAGSAISYDFAATIAADGDTLAISDDLRIALFRRDGDAWTLTDAVEIADPDVHLQRAAPLAVRDDHLAVAVYRPGDGTEAVHLFARTDAGWIADGVLTADHEPYPTTYGGGVALAADELLVGAWGAGAPRGEQSGAVHVYRRSDAARWQQTQVLVPEDPPAGCDCRSAPRGAAPLALLMLALVRRRRRTR